MSQSEENIIARMKKLLAMSEGTANENEAMIAAKQLHAMLAKHNISLEELSTEENPIDKEGFESYNSPWKRIVGGKIAELYFCSFYYQRSYSSNKKASMMFVGTQANRIFAIHIMKLLVKVIEREARKESKKIYGKENCGFVNSFWVGAQRRIVERCDELVKSAKAGTLEDEDGNTLPALLSVYEQTAIHLGEWTGENLNLTTTKSRTQVTNAKGFEKGKEAGSKVQLSRALHNKQSPKLLGN